MDLIVPHSWLQDFCKPSLKPKELAARVSLSGPSIDRVHLEKNDALYEVEITTNRPDAFSIIGFAREVAAILGIRFDEILDSKKLAARIKKITAKKSKSEYSLSVRIENPDLCSRYIGLVVNNVKVGPSPEWMQKRLEQCGQRAINNVVDITNYIMLEYGQPMHAFDADKLVARDAKGGDSRAKEIIVRNAKAGEKFVSLDGDTKSLKPSMLVIADHEGPIAIAGIKGGKRSGIDEYTQTVILEAAHFNAVNVRTTSRQIDIRTDSSSRFEKNLSAELPPYALLRATELLCEYAGGVVGGSIVDQYPRKVKTTTIRFASREIERVVGVSLSQKESAGFLRRLGFEVSMTGEKLTVRVPFWREGDVENDRDLVEEVARLYGYDRIPLESIGGPVPLDARDPSFFWEHSVKHLLKARGWTEVMGYSFVSEKLLTHAHISPGACVSVVNPLSLEFTTMRPSILPSIFDALASNEQRADSLNLFELSAVYHPKKKNVLPHEPLMLSGAVMRKGCTQEDLFREIKGMITTLAGEVFGSHASKVSFRSITSEHHWVAQNAGVEVMFSETVLGFAGIPHSELLSNFDIKNPPCIFELSFTDALSHMSTARSFSAIQKYPSVQRDIAFVVSKKHTYKSIHSALKDVDPLIDDVTLFDVFENAKLGVGNHSMAFRVTYLSSERTLLAQEVETVHNRLKQVVQEDFSADLR